MRLIAVALGCLLLCGAGAPPDWKIYAWVRQNGVGDVWLFDAAGVRTLANKHRQVWTRGFSETAVAKAKVPAETANRAGMKMLKGYIPPLSTLTKMEPKAQDGIVVVEQVSDDNIINPHDQVLWELDCEGGAGKIVTAVSIDSKGRTATAEGNDTWGHSPPQSAGDNLMRLVCK